MFTALLYFCLGLVEDLIVTNYYRAISNRRRWLASHISAIHTIVVVGMMANVVICHNWMLIVFWAAGNWLGTFLGMGKGVQNKP